MPLLIHLVWKAKHLLLVALIQILLNALGLVGGHVHALLQAWSHGVPGGDGVELLRLEGVRVTLHILLVQVLVNLVVFKILLVDVLLLLRLGLGEVYLVLLLHLLVGGLLGWRVRC